MKVAVISLGSTLGKTCFCATLGGVYSRTQGRPCAIFSTSDAIDNIEIVNIPVKNDDLINPYVAKTQIEQSDKGNESTFNYGLQAGDEKVFIFNIMGCAMDLKEKEEFLIAGINKVPAALTLVEINGDITSELNQTVLKECDMCLCLVDASAKTFRTLEGFIKLLPYRLQDRVAYVISRYDDKVISDKELSKKSNIPMKVMLKFPYSSVVARLAHNGNLDRIAYEIVVGNAEVTQFRVKMQEIMEFIFNTSTRKIVREISRWYK